VADLTAHTTFLHKTEAERDLLREQLKESKRLNAAATRRVRQLEGARDIVNQVLLITQEEVSALVADVVTLALSTVYGDEYRFEMEHKIARNQSEIVPWIVKDGERLSPNDEVGGGVIDVAAMALRMAVWAVSEPRPAPVFLLDEPGKFISRDKQASFGRMLREVASMLGIQILLVSHSTAIIEAADRAYEVSQVRGISEVRLLEEAGSATG